MRIILRRSEVGAFEPETVTQQGLWPEERAMNHADYAGDDDVRRAKRILKEYVRSRRRKQLIWVLAILAVLVGIGSCMNCGLRQHAEYGAWEKTVTPAENARIDGLMHQIGEGSYGDALLMKDGGVQMLWNYGLLDPGEKDGISPGEQGVNYCLGIDYGCNKGNRDIRIWNRRDFSEVEKFVKKNPDDPEWNKLAGKFLLQ